MSESEVRARSRHGEVLLEAEAVTVEFGATSNHGPKRTVTAVNGVTLSVKRGETFGLVGESGSGKTTFGRALLKAVPASAGQVRYYDRDGTVVDVLSLDRKGLRKAWRNLQMIFQDPYSSLNPRMTVMEIIGEPLVANRLARGAELARRVRAMALRCGLSTEHLGRYPHAFSGGQRQRIAIARALILEPEFVVCDEAVSALDVSIQAQILNLLKELQAEFDLTYLFIAHDLSVVSLVSDRVAVMYLGRIVETGPTERIFRAPLHPYTEALLSAIPSADPDKPMEPVLLEGERPDPADPPVGCAFQTRCRYATDICRLQRPELIEVSADRWVACHLAADLDLRGALQHEAGTSAL